MSVSGVGRIGSTRKICEISGGGGAGGICNVEVCVVGGAGWSRGVFVCGSLTALRKNRARLAAIRIHCGTVTIPRLGLTILETQIIQKFLVPVQNVRAHTAQRNSRNRPRLRTWVSANIKTSSQVLRGPGLCSTGPGTIGIVLSRGRIPCLWPGTTSLRRRRLDGLIHHINRPRDESSLVLTAHSPGPEVTGIGGFTEEFGRGKGDFGARNIAQADIPIARPGRERDGRRTVEGA